MLAIKWLFLINWLMASSLAANFFLAIPRSMGIRDCSYHFYGTVFIHTNVAYRIVEYRNVGRGSVSPELYSQ